MDNDGLPDIAIAADFVTSQLFWSNGDGTYTLLNGRNGFTKTYRVK